MTEIPQRPTISDDDTLHLVKLLLERSGLPASAAEVATLTAGAPAVQAAVARLYAVPLDRELEPGTVFRAR